ncbi:MAG TPA: hydrogenase maturation nickel metallochaperone HypA [Anaerolineales bacterium]
MYEFSITQKLLDVALKEAKSRRIVNVNLLIGSFSEEREESIQFYWRDLTKGTFGEGAELHFQHVEADMKCFGCGGALGFDDKGSICAYCQNNSQLLSGEDIKLESIDVE